MPTDLAQPESDLGSLPLCWKPQAGGDRPFEAARDAWSGVASKMQFEPPEVVGAAMACLEVALARVPIVEVRRRGFDLLLVSPAIEGLKEAELILGLDMRRQRLFDSSDGGRAPPFDGVIGEGLARSAIFSGRCSSASGRELAVTLAGITYPLVGRSLHAWSVVQSSVRDMLAVVDELRCPATGYLSVERTLVPEDAGQVILSPVVYGVSRDLAPRLRIASLASEEAWGELSARWNEFIRRGGLIEAGEPMSWTTPDSVHREAWSDAFLMRAFPPVRFVQRQIREAVGEIVNHMRPEIIRLMRSVGDLRPELYNWLAAGGDEARSLRRCQALRAFPAIGEVLPNLTGTNIPRWSRGAAEDAKVALLGDDIDAERPILDRIAEVTGATPSAVKAIGGVSRRSLICDLPGFNVTLGNIWSRYLSLAARLQPERMPGRIEGADAPLRGAQWICFGALGSFLDWETSRSTPALMPEDFCRGGAMPPWGRAKVLASRQEFGALLKRAVSARDAILGAQKEIYLAAGLRHIVEQGIATDDPRFYLGVGGMMEAWPDLRACVLGDRGFEALVDVAEEWHRRHPGIADAKGVDPASRATLRWPALSIPCEVEGVQVMPLCTGADLDAEGMDLEHCVGNYVTTCLLSDSHILSLRDGDGKRLSTAEVKIVAGEGLAGVGFEVVQHQGRKNTPPPPVAVAALEGYVAALTRGDLPVDSDYLHVALHERKRTMSGIEVDLVGYPLHRADGVFEAYRFFLPRSFRGLEMREWAERTGIASAAMASARAGERGGCAIPYELALPEFPADDVLAPPRRRLA